MRWIRASNKNPAGRTLQYGLIAEEINQVYPGLVAHSRDGRIETVMYQFLPPMLLNEYQKQQRTIAAQALEMTRLAAEISRQTERIAGLEKRASEFAMLKQQMAELHRHAGGWTGRSRQACGSEICLGAGKRRLLKHVMLPKRVR